MRTVLTLLGLIVGITSVLLMTGIGRGFEQTMQEGLSSLLPTKLNIRQGFDPEGGPVSPLTTRDADLLRTFVGRSSIQAVAPVKELYDVQLDGLDDSQQFVSVVASTTDYQVTENMQFQRGRFFTADEERQKARVAVVNQVLLDTLSLLGQSDLSAVYIGNKPFTIVGVMDDSDFFGGFPKIVAPMTLLGRDLYSQSLQWDNGAPVMDSISVLAVNVDQVETAKVEVERMLRLGHDLGAAQRNDFFIEDQRQTLDTISSFNRGFTLVLGGIGSISLIVGGIGIMNIMLATISERTREIGVRKAIGASDIDIMLQFLVEAIAVCLLGGLLGVLLSYGLSKLLGMLIPPDVFGDAGIIIDLRSVMTATLFSVSAGILFGLYPALRAMRLDPIDALRTE
ncbi:MAG: ABC transporter permease [Caldilineaceae bacterium]